jgi:hypothetical protein
MRIISCISETRSWTVNGRFDPAPWPLLDDGVELDGVGGVGEADVDDDLDMVQFQLIRSLLFVNW